MCKCVSVKVCVHVVCVMRVIIAGEQVKEGEGGEEEGEGRGKERGIKVFGGRRRKSSYLVHIR